MVNPNDVPVSGTGAARAGVVDWGSFVPKRVDSEDTLGPEQNKKVWEKLYKEAGLSSAGEDDRRALRAAVYVYCAKNGTSREGEYSGEMQLASGKTVSAAAIVRAAGRMRVRRFLRANMMESYDFFKSSRVMEADERFVSKCSSLGVPAECAFATADWLGDCPQFTPGETKAHEITFVRGIDRAKRARGGKTLEDVESQRQDANLHAQGPSEASGEAFRF